MPNYIPIQDLTGKSSISDNDYVPVSDGSTAYGVRAELFKTYTTAAAEAAAARAEAAAEYVEENLADLEAEVSKTVKKIPGKNLFDPNASGITENAYIREQKDYRSSTSYIVSDWIPVTPGETYYLSGCTVSTAVRAAFFNNLKGFISTHLATDGSIVAPENAVYLRVTITKTARYTTAMVTAEAVSYYQPYTDEAYALFDLLATTHDPTAQYDEGAVVSKDGLFYKAVHPITTPGAFSTNDWGLVRSLADGVKTQSTGVQFNGNSVSVSGSTAGANTLVEMPGTSVSKNVIYAFWAKFSTFTKISIGKGSVTAIGGSSNTKYASWIEIDGTNLKVYRVGDTLASKTYAHGLTFSKFVAIQIITTDEYTCNVKIQTDGGEYATNETASWMGNCRGTYWFYPAQAMTDYSYTVTFKDGMKPVYLFGDSYMSFTNQRWVYYLKELGLFDSILICNCSGINSAGMIESLNALPGHPKFALWAIGMNDPDDTDSTTPAANWVTGFNTFVNWCNSHGCTPIFGTIPTTGTEINDGKNYYIRNSGYRYVDFAKAMTYDNNGTTMWYDGMLSEDGLHPDVAGAIASMNRVLLDFPEIAGTL